MADPPPGTEELAEPRSRWPRVASVLVAVLVALVVVVRIARGGGGGAPHRADGPTSPPAAATSSSAPAPQASASTDDEYLLDVPAQDMRAALTDPACRGRCTAHVLTDAALTRSTAGFAGMRPLAGGVVTRAGTGAYLRSVEGYARADALVHLFSEHVHLQATSIRSTDSRGPGYRTLVLAIVRGGWRLTVTLVVRGTAPPIAAATTWLTSSPLPS